MRLAFLRHGPTGWNALGRIQGRTDIPLSAEGRVKMAAMLPPQGFERARAFCSVLNRTRETAELLGYPNALADRRLVEHHWGEWEGLTRDQIVARHGPDVFTRAGIGIDFTPKGGESTRDLLARVADFIAERGREADDAIAITHRGVLRSAYALATGWDMLTPMPEALDLSCALVLAVDGDGVPRVAELNVPLRRRS